MAPREASKRILAPLSRALTGTTHCFGILLSSGLHAAGLEAGLAAWVTALGTPFSILYTLH
jgi:hypothetical protein